MLYQKRINIIIGDIDKFFDTIDQALLIFGEGVKNYLYTNVEAFKGNLQTMTRLENEAELLRREIEAGLYRQSSLVRLRGDIMRLLEALDHIIDTLNDNLFQFEIERPFIPVELNADFLKITELSTQAVETAIPAAKAYFRTSDSITEKVHRVYFYEKGGGQAGQIPQEEGFPYDGRIKAQPEVPSALLRTPHRGDFNGGRESG